MIAPTLILFFFFGPPPVHRADLPIPAPVATLAVPVNAAVIFDAGTSNAAGFRIVIQDSGDAASVDGAGRGTGRVQADLTARFFAELAAAMPLSKIATHPCADAQSIAPFFVWWRGERSPDLRCADASGAAIAGDARAIARVLYVAEYRTKPMYSHGTAGAGGEVTGAGTAAPEPQSTAASSGGYPPR